jgi:ferredoxin
MRAICNLERCQGHGRCAAAAPAVYLLDDNGYVSTEVIEVPAGREEQARLGAQSCPEEAIRIEE